MKSNLEPSESFKYNIQVLDKALKLFEVLAQSKTPLSIQDLQASTDLNRTTIWRIVSTMADSGFLTQLPSKQYCLSCKACNLLTSASSSAIALKHCAEGEMKRLRQISGETIMLLVPETAGSRTILQLDSFENVRVRNYTNEVSPLFGTSTGIAQLSAMTDEEIIDLFPERLTAYTPYTLTEKEQILERIRSCRRDGYTYIIDEYNSGDTGISAPIYLGNALVGILNISGPTARFTKERLLACVPQLKTSVAHIVEGLSL